MVPMAVPVVMVEAELGMALLGTVHHALIHAAVAIITVVTHPYAVLVATILGQPPVVAVPVPVVVQVEVLNCKHTAI
jgi:hypothetical protein